MLPTRVWPSSVMAATTLVATVLVLTCFCAGVTEGVMCYQCNSEYDPRCGDPFDEYGLGKVNCSMKELLEHLPNIEPTLCRKTTQKIFGRVRVIRDCGYLPDKSQDSRECLKRSGTFEVQSHFCSCSTDLCNAAPPGAIGGGGHQMALVAAAIVGLLLVGGGGGGSGYSGHWLRT